MTANGSCMSEFLQDNLLSEDDWGALNLVDLSDLTSASTKSLLSNDFCIGDSGAGFQEYYGYSDDSEDKHVDQSSSLSPPSSDHQDLVDELLEDIMHTRNSVKTNHAEITNTNEDHFLPRRCSTNTSSSAYSSCSSDSFTPPPQSMDQMSDQASCSSGEHSFGYLSNEQDTLTNEISVNLDPDYQPYNNPVPPLLLMSENEGAPKNDNLPGSIFKSSRSTRYKHPQTTRRKAETNSDETDLERAVRLACEETNRLLRMHKTMSPKDSDTEKKKKGTKSTQPRKDLLQDVCESTILGSHVPRTKTVTKATHVSASKESSNHKPLKRKATSCQKGDEKLQFVIKKPSLLSHGRTLQQAKPFSRSALINSNEKSKNTPRLIRPEDVSVEHDDSCIIISQPQTPLKQPVTLNGLTINPTQTFTITPSPAPITSPLRFYLKQEASPTLQTGYPVINGLNNQNVLVSTGLTSNSNFTLSVQNPAISIVNPTVAQPEPILCQGGQTIVIQQAPTTSAPPLQHVNISSMKPGSEPVVLSQSDLSRLAAQGVIKFPNKKMERNLMPTCESSQRRSEPRPTPRSPPAPRKANIVPAMSDMLPNKAAAIINGTSVFRNVDNQPQRGELDIKALKRHQRMIKNRASACQSRQRRKEYLKTLEDQVTEVAEENKLLREQNDYLNTRVSDLEVENDNLRSFLGIERSNQKKAACVLMLMLFIGINFFPVGLFGKDSPFQTNMEKLDQGFNSALPVSAQSQPSIRSGRHLLSLSNADGNVIEMDKGGQDGSQKPTNDLIVSNKQSYWMDDLVRQYKDKHLENFLQLLSETTSNSAKRLLRRKLKEEFGISIPLPVPRHRRIAYTPRSRRLERPTKIQTDTFKTVKSEPTETLRSASNNEQYVGSKETVKMPISLQPPCEQTAFDESELNETETIRVNNALVEWAQRYTVDRQVKAQENAQKKNVERKKYTSTKAPSARYEQNDNSTVNNEIAVYSRPNKKYDDFFDAINRRNDTFYVVSLNKEHLLLPATVQNSSSRMKMALVMPAITSKERSSHSSDEYETMIHIECEVISTRMFELKRKDVPEFLIVPKAASTNDTITSVKDTRNQIPVDTKSSLGSKTDKTSSNKKKRKSNFNAALRKMAKKGKHEEEEDAVVSDVVDSDQDVNT